ncbi:hypothetical protein [uncultured Aquimarina sp.]|uniref:hypothetical protein n=1 Tax=uncultured Aquimarina sp. TaxID=575652 RepID=UPI002621C428|nr:hypothetical protein [uncultured Aquimarina sp.]
MFIRTNQILTRILYFIVFVTFSYQNLQSQIPYVKPDGEKIELSDFKGTPYLDKEFQKGVVHDGLTGKENNLFLRYDALNDLFEMKDTKVAKNKKFLKKAFEVYVVFNGKTFYYQNYINDDGRSVVGYLHEIARVADKTIYMKYGKNLVMPEKAATSLEQDRPGRIKNETYYVVGVSNKLKATEIKKKNVLDHFPDDKKGKLKEFIKKNRLKFKDYSDIKKLADYMEKI